jgi:hypothetical protein
LFGPDWGVCAKVDVPASAVTAAAISMDFIIPLRKLWLTGANASSPAMVPVRELRGTGPIGHHRG